MNNSNQDELEKKNNVEALETSSKSDDYEFIREKISERPINKKKLARKMAMTAGAAVLFGLIACTTILLLEPVLSKFIKSGSKKDKVNLTKVELTEGTTADGEDVKVEIDDTPYYEETPIEDLYYDDNGVSNNTVSSNEPILIENKVGVELEDYQLLGRKMYALSKAVSKSLVTVTSVSSDKDLLNERYQSTKSTTGVIMAASPHELYILADYDNMTNVESVKIAFASGKVVDAYIKSVDLESGLAVYAVRMISLDNETKQSYTVATLGTSSPNIVLGTPVIAVGDPLGTGSSVSYGYITSASTKIGYVDATYQLLSTDIMGSKNGNGVLVNMRGQVVGFITNRNDNSELQNLVWAYGINGIKSLVEDMSNGRNRKYLGLYIADVPAGTKQAYGITGYIYAKRVDMDSNSFNVGIVSGDVIKAINGEPVSSTDDYMKKLQSLKDGNKVRLTIERLSDGRYKEINVLVDVSTKDR